MMVCKFTERGDIEAAVREGLSKRGRVADAAEGGDALISQRIERRGFAVHVDEPRRWEGDFDETRSASVFGRARLLPSRLSRASGSAGASPSRNDFCNATFELCQFFRRSLIDASDDDEIGASQSGKRFS